MLKEQLFQNYKHDATPGGLTEYIGDDHWPKRKPKAEPVREERRPTVVQDGVKELTSVIEAGNRASTPIVRPTR